jgi:hypothetical protein
MAKLVDPGPAAQIYTTAPAQQTRTQEWSLIHINADSPNLTHQSDNPFDFLSAAKLDKIICFWNDDITAANSLTRADREVLGQLKTKKILAKVVSTGSPPIDDEKKNTWIHSTIISAIAQKEKMSRHSPNRDSRLTLQSRATLG